MTLADLKRQIRTLYEDDRTASHIFRITLVVLDAVTIALFVLQSAMTDWPYWPLADLVMGVYIATDFLIRLWLARVKRRFFTQISSWADIAVMISLIAPIWQETLGFLRVARTLRLLRSYHMLREFRKISPWFRRHEETIQSAVNLFVFLFVVTACVFVAEADRNPDIDNYLDALYFTVTTLTTTGFGDITMRNTQGRLLAVVIMVFGVALFLRLVQTLFRPTKVFFKCPECGLSRHDPDAVHCKHCGTTINIPTEGEW